MDFRELLGRVLLVSLPTFQILWDTGVVLDWTESLTSSIILPALSSGEDSRPTLSAKPGGISNPDFHANPLSEEPPLSRLLFPPAQQPVCRIPNSVYTGVQVASDLTASNDSSEIVAGVITGVSDHPLVAALGQVSGSLLPQNLRASPLVALLLCITVSIALLVVWPRFLSRSKPRRREPSQAPLGPIIDDLYDETFGSLAAPISSGGTSSSSNDLSMVIPQATGSPSDTHTRTTLFSLQPEGTVAAQDSNVQRSTTEDTSVSPLEDEELMQVHEPSSKQDSEPAAIKGDFDTTSQDEESDHFLNTSGTLCDTTSDMEDHADLSLSVHSQPLSPVDVLEPSLAQEHVRVDDAVMPVCAEFCAEPSSPVAADGSQDESGSDLDTEASGLCENNTIAEAVQSECLPPPTTAVLEPYPTSILAGTTSSMGSTSDSLLSCGASSMSNTGHILESPDYTPARSFPFMTPQDNLEKYLGEAIDDWDWTLVNLQLHEQGTFVRDYRSRSSPETHEPSVDTSRTFTNHPNTYIHLFEPSLSRTIHPGGHRRTESDTEHIYRRNTWLVTRADVDPEPLLSPPSTSRFRSLSSRVGLLLPARSLRPPRPLEELDLAVPEEKDLLECYHRLCKSIKAHNNANMGLRIPYGLSREDFLIPQEQTSNVSHVSAASPDEGLSTPHTIVAAPAPEPSPAPELPALEADRDRNYSAVNKNDVTTEAHVPSEQRSYGQRQDQSSGRGPSPSATVKAALPSASVPDQHPTLLTNSRPRSSSFQSNLAAPSTIINPFGKRARGTTEGGTPRATQEPSKRKKGIVSGMVINADRAQPSWAPTRQSSTTPNAWAQSISRPPSRTGYASTSTNWRSRDPSPAAEPGVGASSNNRGRSLAPSQQSLFQPQPRRGRTSLGVPILPTPPAASPPATDYTTTLGQFDSAAHAEALQTVVRTQRGPSPQEARVDDEDALPRFAREHAEARALAFANGGGV